MNGMQENWARRGIIFMACVAGAIWLGAGDVQAQYHPPATLDMPSNDGGITIAPPRQLAAKAVACGASQKTVTIQNPNDTDQNPGLCNIRVGNSRVKAFPVNKKNGIILTPGQAMSFDIYASGNPYITSECTNDAGVAAGTLCGSGGLP